MTPERLLGGEGESGTKPGGHAWGADHGRLSPQVTVQLGAPPSATPVEVNMCPACGQLVEDREDPRLPAVWLPRPGSRAFMSVLKDTVGGRRVATQAETHVQPQ